MTTHPHSPFDRGVGTLAEEGSSGGEGFGRRWLVTIGIDEYEHWPPLVNAVHDADGVDRLLVTKMDFESSPSLQLRNKACTKVAIDELIQSLLPATVAKDDSLVLFFAGHGHSQVVLENDERVKYGYLIPVEARNDQPDDYVSLEEFLGELSKLMIRHILVILDACHSGIALGRGVMQKTVTGGLPADPIDDQCRMVISSARWDQKASDIGPIENHSLFTGYLLQGLDWGTAALWENSLLSLTPPSVTDTEVTSRELGLFLQKQVGMASQNRQTPDYGVFKTGARGFLSFSLDTNSYQSIKTRAFAALQHGDIELFLATMNELSDPHADNPWTDYLLYRKALLEDQIDIAHQQVTRLRDRNLQRGTLPLAQSDLVSLEVQLRLFRSVLALPEASDQPLQVKLEVAPDIPEMWEAGVDPYMSPASHISIPPDRDTFTVPLDAIARYRVGNLNMSEPIHIYFLTIRPDGRLVMGPLLQDPDLAIHGLGPGDESQGVPFKVANVGMTETRLLCSDTSIPSLLRPPTTATRSQDAYRLPDHARILRQTVWYWVFPPT